MHPAISSKHLRGTTELMLLVPIRSGFVESTTPMSYATRLRLLLSTLFELRRRTVEERLAEGSGPIERLQAILSTQWAVLEDAQPAQLLVSAVFDRSWEDYVQLLAEKTGKLLDAIFCHCVGYESHTCADGHEAFSAYLRAHQVRCDFFHAGMPDLTLDDLRFFKKALKHTQHGAHPGTMTIGSVLDEDPQAPSGAETSGLEQLQKSMEGLFPDVPEFPDRSARTARTLLREALLSLGAPEPPAQTGGIVELGEDDLNSIQGGILTSYSGMNRGWILLVQCRDASAATRLIERVLPNVTREASPDGSRPRVNLAFTYEGLRRLGLDERTLSLLPQEFREGMAARAGILGDVGPSHPNHWQELVTNWPTRPLGKRFTPQQVDAVLVVQTRRDGSHDEGDGLPPELAALELDETGARVLHVQPLRRTFEPDGQYREHFGFLDTGAAHSGSQPVPYARVRGRSLAEGRLAADVVPLGEILLGYENRHGTVAPCADERTSSTAALFKNGSFLVLRKLEQHVEALQNYAQNAPFGSAPNTVKAWLLGRDTEGKPLITGTATNDFDYRDDASGVRCPLHAHVRRANPRTPGLPSPRVLRRGFAYGSRYSPETASEERGLMFMGYNASISTQFEVVQRWLNGGNSTGILSAQNDLLTGSPQPSGAPHYVAFGGALQALPPAPRPFVSLRWGYYLFVPSRDALALLARGKVATRAGTSPSPTPSELVSKGSALVQKLDALSDPKVAVQEWKRMLEEPACRSQASAIWAAIRANGTPKTTPYGVLVGTLPEAREVLTDRGQKFSVRRYWERLSSTMGEHYLGLDADVGHASAETPIGSNARYEARLQEVTYQDLSSAANRYLQGLAGNAFAEGYEQSKAFLGAQPATPFANGATPQRRVIPLKQLAQVVVGRVAQRWIGMPLPPRASDEDVAEFLGNFIIVSQYCFQPHPDAWLAKLARACGAALQSSYQNERPLKGDMASRIRAELPNDEQRVQQAMIGAIVGFAAPAVATILSVIDLWANSGELARIALVYSELEPSAGRRWLMAALTDAMVRAPVPPILYRTAMSGSSLGGVTVDSGRCVILGLHSVCEHAAELGEPEPWQWIFGGPHGGSADRERPLHGCPARPAALDVILGALAALFEAKDLQTAGSSLVLSCDATAHAPASVRSS